MRRTRTFATLLIAAVLAPAVLGACEKEGPAERAGKDVDRAMDKAGDKVKEAGDRIKDVGR